MKICPYCGEKIKEGAKKCRYCKNWLIELHDKGKIGKELLDGMDLRHKVVYFLAFLYIIMCFVVFGPAAIVGILILTGYYFLFIKGLANNKKKHDTMAITLVIIMVISIISINS